MQSFHEKEYEAWNWCVWPWIGWCSHVSDIIGSLDSSAQSSFAKLSFFLYCLILLVFQSAPIVFYRVLTGYLLIQIYWPKIRYCTSTWFSPYQNFLPFATSLRRRLFLHRLACLPLFWDTKQLLKYNIFFYSLDKFWSNNLSDVKYTWNNAFFFNFFVFFFFIYGFIFLFLSINDINGYCLIGRSRDYLRAVYLGQIEFNKNRKPIAFFSSVIWFCC